MRTDSAVHGQSHLTRSTASENSAETGLKQTGGAKSFCCVGKDFRIAF